MKILPVVFVSHTRNIVFQFQFFSKLYFWLFGYSKIFTTENSGLLGLFIPKFTF